MKRANVLGLGAYAVLLAGVVAGVYCLLEGL